MLDVYDWLSNVYYIDDEIRHPLIEVRFKGTRKGFYRNTNNLAIEIGQKIVVEAQMGGHDVGVVSLVGPLVKVQMKKYRIKEDSEDIKKVYRLATENDIEKWQDAKAREYVTMMKSRDYARDLRLQMKISDVEFQGDNTKATFYYTADGRVDFRELIKIFAKNFKIKVEMRQIGLRQEAGRLGGIGSCGRELCCSTWLTDFNTVPTTAARYQNLFLNPLKLSGQCGRLKCCLNYELDTYLEALEDFPDDNVTLKTAKGRARVVKTDILRKVMFFVVDDDPTSRFIPLDVADVKDLVEQQKQGKLAVIEDIEEYSVVEEKVAEIAISGDIMADDLDRFDRKKTNTKKRRPNNKRNKNPRNNDRNETKDAAPTADAAPRRKSRPEGQRPNRKPRPDGPKDGSGKPGGNNDSRPKKTTGRADNTTPKTESRTTQGNDNNPKPKNEGKPSNRNRNNRNKKPRNNNPNRGNNNPSNN